MKKFAEGKVSKKCSPKVLFLRKLLENTFHQKEYTKKEKGFNEQGSQHREQPWEFSDGGERRSQEDPAAVWDVAPPGREVLGTLKVPTLSRIWWHVSDK